MKDKELWMSKMKEKLGDYSEPLPEFGWERLEKELMPPTKKKTITIRRWVMSTAAVILLALVSSLSLYFLGTPDADSIRHSQVPALASIPDALPHSNTPDATTTGTEQSIRRSPVDNRIAINRTVPALSRKRVENNVLSEVKEEKATATKENVDLGIRPQKTIEETVNVAPENKVEDNPTVTRPRRPSSKDKLHVPADAKSGSRKNTWSTSLSVNSSGGASTELSAGVGPYMARVSMASVSNGLVSIPNDQMVVFQDGVPYLYAARQVVDIKHHQPISVGASVRKNLNRGFSVETGLTYTLLSSDATFADSDHSVEQKLHYIGIPLKANWNFLDKKLVTLYVTGGGMVEKCVYGKLGSEKETVKPLQFSVSGGVGAQINATKRLGFYVEPGVAYYFDDGSDVQTIRKEHPFNFKLHAGIRLSY